MATAKRVIRCHNCGAILQCEHKNQVGFISKAIVENGVPKIPYCNQCYDKMLALNSSNLEHETDKDIIKILNDEKLKAKYLEELNDSRLMLLKRTNLFKEEIKKEGIDILPYDSGFFVSIKTDRSDEIYEALRKLKLHIVPFTNSIRITIASITLDEVKRIPKLLKQVI